VITILKLLRKKFFLLAKFIKTNESNAKSGLENKKFLFQIGSEWEINFCKNAFYKNKIIQGKPLNFFKPPHRNFSDYVSIRK